MRGDSWGGEGRGLGDEGIGEGTSMGCEVGL